jgi:hypothetical protein
MYGKLLRSPVSGLRSPAILSGTIGLICTTLTCSAAWATGALPGASVWLVSEANQSLDTAWVGWAATPGVRVLDVEWSLLRRGVVQVESGVSLQRWEAGLGVEALAGAGGGWLDDDVYMERVVVYYSWTGDDRNIGLVEDVRPVRVSRGTLWAITQQAYDDVVSPKSIGSGGRLEYHGASVPSTSVQDATATVDASAVADRPEVQP